MKKKFFIAAIVARCGGNFPSEVCCTLFEKQSSNEFEQVGIDTRRCAACMRLCRCWVGLPAYSSLVLDVDLSEFGTERKLLKETIELRVEKVGVSNDELIVDDDIYIRVSVRWVSPTPQGRQESCGMELEEDDDESSDDEMSRGDEQMTEASCSPVASSSNPASHWALHAHQIRPFSTPSLEIFSVFIDYYRIVLFKRNRDDPAQPGTDGFTALSRSMVIVPLNSSLIIEANLVNGLVDQVLSYYL
ncbi:hypothetical protein PHJA_000151800 [Phtheirospermum japonicum]|uniref:Uncharacterized protein n=1 Tax=Phtheirospermum japonicum TaxID=374723 RepID=A0A830B643_9LAMI|nr:hypothetical protein PHJA_000151800 [Phtheirospermum japonicum]